MDYCKGEIIKWDEHIQNKYEHIINMNTVHMKWPYFKDLKSFHPGNCQLLFCGLHRRLPLILWVPILESKFSNTLKVDWIYIASGLTQIFSISFFCLRPSFLYTRHKICITSLCICSNLFLEPFLRGFECSFSESWTE